MTRRESEGEQPEEPREACGVFGVYAAGMDVARLTYFGLFALQHRGQESAGIAVSNGREIVLRRGMGLVSQVFDEEALSALRGDIAIGHNRYSTTGASLLRNAQPVLAQHNGEVLTLGHNGNLVNTVPLRKELEASGASFETTLDTEVIGKLIGSYKGSLEEAITQSMAQLRGAFSVTLLTRDRVIAFRDPWGVRPLCIGRLNGSSYVFASETCALNVVGADFVREVLPGEVVIADEHGLRQFQAVPRQGGGLCIFEFIYFARPDSHIYGKSLHTARRRMGNLLAQEHPAQADLVIPVPDTGTPAAIGYAEVSRIPFGEGLIKNRYIHRTFIQPDQRLRDMGVRMKLTPLREALKGKRVVVVEDSIVRGTTTRNIVGVLKEAGAKEVHLRISSPPYRFPCFYGIDTAVRGELIAAARSVEEICEFIGADSLGYLSLESLFKAVGLPRQKVCRACFAGRYPIQISREMKGSKFALE